MAAQELVDQEYTLTDGASVAVNVYWDDSDSDRPVVGLISGSGGDRETAEGRAQTLAANGFLVFTMDHRGSGTYGVANGAAKGRAIFQARDILDVMEIIEGVISAHSAKVDSTKIGLAGTSRGGWMCWVLMALSDKLPIPEMQRWRTQRFPKLTAVAPAAFIHDVTRAYLLDGQGPTGNALNILKDVGSTVYETDFLADSRAALTASDEDYAEWLGGNNNPSGHNLQDVTDCLTANDHTYVLAHHDWDDIWVEAGPVIDTIRALSGRDPSRYPVDHACVIGSTGAHQTTAVTAEVNQFWAQRLAFFQSRLLADESGVAANFGTGSPATWADVSEVQFSLTPNDTTEYQLAATFTDPYSRAAGYSNKAGAFLGGHDSSINANATRYYPNASGSALSETADESQSTFTIQNVPGATTRAGFITDIAGGDDTGTWINANLTRDTQSFTINYPGSGHELIVGSPVVNLWAQANKTDAILSVDLVYITGGGSGVHHITSGAYRFDQAYPEGTPQQIQITLDACAFRIKAGAGVAFGLRFSNAALKDPPYSGYDGISRPIPTFEDNSVVVYYGGSVTDTYLDLPTYPDATTLLDP